MELMTAKIVLTALNVRLNVTLAKRFSRPSACSTMTTQERFPCETSNEYPGSLARP